MAACLLAGSLSTVPAQAQVAAPSEQQLRLAERLQTSVSAGAVQASRKLDVPNRATRERYRRLYREVDRKCRVHECDPGRHSLRTAARRDEIASAAQLRDGITRLRQLKQRLRKAVPPTILAGLRRIAQCESGGDPTAIGGGGLYRGLLQFHMNTWRSVGGRGDPAAASRREQEYRGYLLYRRAGTAPWPHCGARF